MENSETAAYSKVSELDVMNLDISQRLQKVMEENVVLIHRTTQLQGQVSVDIELVILLRTKRQFLSYVVIVSVYSVH